MVIDDPVVSAHHCEIRKVQDCYELVDLGARNGVLVNDRVVREHYLVDKDALRVGRTEFRFNAV